MAAEYEQEVEALVGTAHREPADPGARASPGDGYGLQASWRTHAAAFGGPGLPNAPGGPIAGVARAAGGGRSTAHGPRDDDAADSPDGPVLSRRPRMPRSLEYVFPRC